MDHTPGQGQYRNIETYRKTITAYHGETVTTLGFEGVLEHHKNKRTLSFEQLHELAELARANGIPAASHDDDTAAKLQVNKELGVAISEFPITIDVARQAQQLGLATVVGALIFCWAVHIPAICLRQKRSRKAAPIFSAPTIILRQCCTVFSLCISSTACRCRKSSIS